MKPLPGAQPPALGGGQGKHMFGTMDFPPPRLAAIPPFIPLFGGGGTASLSPSRMLVKRFGEGGRRKKGPTLTPASDHHRRHRHLLFNILPFRVSLSFYPSLFFLPCSPPPEFPPRIVAASVCDTHHCVSLRHFALPPTPTQGDRLVLLARGKIHHRSFLGSMFSPRQSSKLKLIILDSLGPNRATFINSKF